MHLKPVPLLLARHNLTFTNGYTTVQQYLTPDTQKRGVTL